MDGHLTGEQISTFVLEGNGEAARHVEQCPACRAQAEELAGTLAGFGAAVRAEAEREEWHWTRQRAMIRERLLTEKRPTPRWAWVPAGGVLAALLLAVALLLSRAPRTPAPITSDIADNSLLMEVQSDTQREYPAALAPVILINNERNEILSTDVQPADFQPEGGQWQ